MYLDTITVAPDLVKNAEDFFDVLDRATDNRAFSQPCKFRLENKNEGKSVLSIETPGWFSHSNFHAFGEWIAILIEENLWANYNYFRLSK